MLSQPQIIQFFLFAESGRDLIKKTLGVEVTSTGVGDKVISQFCASLPQIVPIPEKLGVPKNQPQMITPFDVKGQSGTRDRIIKR